LFLNFQHLKISDLPTGFTPPMTFWERVKNTFTAQVVSLIFRPRFITPFSTLGKEHFGQDYDIIVSLDFFP
jgi:hypothetical protein